MLCDRCDGQTKPKTITSKKTGEDYTVFECLNGCKNPENKRFAYSFFGPRIQRDGKSQPVKPPVDAKPQASGEAVTLLRSMDTTLKNMLSIMQAKAKLVPVQTSELQPDEEIPF